MIHRITIGYIQQFRPNTFRLITSVRLSYLSTLNDSLTHTRYSSILPVLLSTRAVMSVTSNPLIPWTVFAASVIATWAASSQPCFELPTSSNILATDISFSWVAYLIILPALLRPGRMWNPIYENYFRCLLQQQWIVYPYEYSIRISSLSFVSRYAQAANTRIFWEPVVFQGHSPCASVYHTFWVDFVFVYDAYKTVTSNSISSLPAENSTLLT